MLQAYPVGGGGDVRQQCSLILAAADSACDAGDPSAIEMPRMAVEPDPGCTADTEQRQVALFVVRDDPPCIRIADADQCLAGASHVARLQVQIVDRAIHR